jgi:hypothetical protein
VTGDDRKPGGNLAFDDVQVGPADPAGFDVEEDLTRTRARFGHLGRLER